MLVRNYLPLSRLDSFRQFFPLSPDTFEALLVAADAYKRAGSTDPKALTDAIRATNITDNVSIGAGIQFNAKGQNDKVGDGATQNRSRKERGAGSKAPKAAATPNLSGRCGRTSTVLEAH